MKKDTTNTTNPEGRRNIYILVNHQYIKLYPKLTGFHKFLSNVGDDILTGMHIYRGCNTV